MRKLNRETLIAYTYAWLSFLFREPYVKGKIRSIHLFGSVARNEFDEESDIDVFVNVTQKEAVRPVEIACRRSLKKFYNSKEFKKFELRGIRNEVSPKIGMISKWPELKKSIERESLLLYAVSMFGKLEKGFILILESMREPAKRNRVMRYLFGRRERKFKRIGKVEELGGRKLTARSFLIPAKNFNQIAKFLNKEKVKFTLVEVWID